MVLSHLQIVILFQTFLKSRDGKYRMILSLKKFNEFLLVSHCKLDAVKLITEGYFACIL